MRYASQILLILALSAVPAVLRAEFRYTVLPLNAVIGDFNGFSNHAQMVGVTGSPQGTSTAFRTQPGAPLDPATDLLGAGISVGYGLNDAGQAVGKFNVGGGHVHAFRTAPNQPFNPQTDDLGTLFGGSTTAFAVNSHGQVTGSAGHAFRTGPNQPINPATDDLGTLGGIFSFGFGINDAGQVVGESEIMIGSTHRHAFRTGPNMAINPATDDLGTLGGDRSSAFAINEAGWAVGWAETKPANLTRHAFLVPPGRAIDPLLDDLRTLGGRDSVARAINEHGDVVGASMYDINNAAKWHAFLYQDGIMHDLNTFIDPALRIELARANAINDLGQILAYDNSGNAYLLSPIAVPEPASAVLALLAFLGLLRFAVRGTRVGRA